MTMILWDDEENKVEVEYNRTTRNTIVIRFLVKTAKISGYHAFFLPPTVIEKHIDTLKVMYNNLAGNLHICDDDSDSFILLNSNRDKWFLEGQLGSSWEGNMMMFRIPVDQTVIMLLLDFLQNIVTDLDSKYISETIDGQGEEMPNTAVVTLLEKLISYQSNEISRNELENAAEQILDGVRERMQSKLIISDVFLSHMLQWLTTEKHQAYQKNEIQKLIDGLRGEASVRYHCFIHISQEMLSHYEKQVLDIATEFLTQKTVPAEWNELRQRRMHERTEFKSFTTVPEWLAYQIEYLLWFVMSVKKTTQFHLEEEILLRKIKHLVSILSGKEPALVEVSINSISII